MRLNMKKTLVVATLIICSSAFAQRPTFIGPEGDTQKVAQKIIFVDAEQPCGKIVSTKRVDNGVIYTKCSNGETYLVGVLKNAPMKDGTKKDVPIALKCSMAKDMFGISCTH
jgi:hypothetical protein